MPTAPPLTADALLAAQTALAGLAYLLIKHCVADYLLQTEHQRRTKGLYLAFGGYTHCLTHVALTLPVFLLIPHGGALAVAAIVAMEFIVHYHLDWTKDRAVRLAAWTPQDTWFWWALGIDQMLHGLTYVAIVWLALYSATV